MRVYPIELAKAAVAAAAVVAAVVVAVDQNMTERIFRRNFHFQRDSRY